MSFEPWSRQARSPAEQRAARVLNAWATQPVAPPPPLAAIEARGRRGGVRWWQWLPLLAVAVWVVVRHEPQEVVTSPALLPVASAPVAAVVTPSAPAPEPVVEVPAVAHPRHLTPRPPEPIE